MKARLWRIRAVMCPDPPIYSIHHILAPASMDAEALRRGWERQYGVEVVEVEEIEKIEVNGILEYPDVLDVEVIRIERAKGREIYGDKAGESKDADFFVIYVENKEYGVLFREPVRDSRTKDGRVPERSKLGKWISLYGVPHKGQKVKAIKDAKGYYRVKLI